MISYVDTDEVNSIAREINDATSDLEAEINNLFKRLAEVLTVTKEWMGGQAEKYFAKTESDKRTYDQAVLQLRDFSQELSREAGRVEANVKENNTAD